MAACLLVGCTAGDPEAAGEAGGRRQQTATATPEPSSEAAASPARPGQAPDPPRAVEPLRGLPEVPGGRDPAAVARQIDLARAVVRDPAAARADVRRAGEFTQHAAIVLATSADRLRESVLARLRPSSRLVTRGDVRAAALLRSMTGPQTTLPRWRIVTPRARRELLAHYRGAQRRTGVPWTTLAAIHLVETRMGRIRGVSSAGARGPMQFLPSTWAIYGAGGDIDDPRDAILAAARLLRSNGALRDLPGALWHYNPSAAYVGAVTEYARSMRRSASAYRGYWHWRVLYRHVRGTYLLPVGYPRVPPVRVKGLPAGDR